MHKNYLNDISEKDKEFVNTSYQRQIILYSLAFGILIILLLISYFYQRDTIRQQHDFAKIINISSNQKMLTQRIVGLALRFKVETDSNIHQGKDLVFLKEALALFTSTQILLMQAKDHPESLGDLNNSQTDKIYKEYFNDLLLFVSEALNSR